jgi:hypothetical protein
MTLVIHQGNHLSEKENKCVETEYICDLIVCIVNKIKNKKDLHRLWGQSAFGFNL